MERPFIPVYAPYLGGNEKKYVNECLDTSWISSRGRFVSEFETLFCASIGVPYATAVCNGTVALHLALMALGITWGDEVIVPTFTYIASVNSIVYTGAKPVFVDSLSSSWQLDPRDVERKITPRTKAIMAVHLYGIPCDIESITEIARNHGIYVVEDCAEAFGATCKGRFAGSFGDIAAFSFFGNKTITTGEGGMVISSNPKLIERSYHLKTQGVDPHREYWHDIVGYNYRMTNICAAIGVAQLEQAERILEMKQRQAERYVSGLEGTPLATVENEDNISPSYWMITFMTRSLEERNDLRSFLASKNIETRPTFPPAHMMAMYGGGAEKFPIAEDLGGRGINLPSFPHLRDDELSFIIESIREFYRIR